MTQPETRNAIEQCNPQDATRPLCSLPKNHPGEHFHSNQLNRVWDAWRAGWSLEQLQLWLLDEMAQVEIRYEILDHAWRVTIMHPGNRFDGRGETVRRALERAVNEAESWDQRCREAGRWLPR